MSELLAGKYLLGRLLGQGGMGQVYEAEQVMVHRKVAVKVLRPGLAMDPDAVKRLQREAETLAALDHPNLVRFLDFGQDEGQVYLVMELLLGEDLMQILDRAGPAPFDRIVPILIDVLRALEACHAKGVIHRDLKPSNIFLARLESGGAITKILDFGVARAAVYEGTALTMTGGLVGTACYMAPEQARGEDIDTRADLYSIGAILYHALTGCAPYEATTFQGILARVLTEDPPPLRTRRPEIPLPEVAERLCAWSMSRDRNARPKTAAELRDAFEESITGRRSIPLLPKATKPKKEDRRGGLFWVVAIGLVVAGIAAGAIGMASFSGASATASVATAAPTTAPMTAAVLSPAPRTVPAVEITPTAPVQRPIVQVPASPLSGTPTPPTTPTIEATDADLAAASRRPACAGAQGLRGSLGGTPGVEAMALSLAALNTPSCGDCAAFARAAIRRSPSWDLPHFQLASCLTAGGAADACTVANEIRAFQDLTRRPQPPSAMRPAYRRSAQQMLATFSVRCGR